ncbi:HAMP domain-containing methyl-accepting chemotaxis protein [Azotosporobacter soli]|uniref:methyl-accepting chemotaxis protein n=1 Tax=Azotosporobacter soli TaxID=3055040 RepID=UPI0031FEA6A6
MGSKMSLMKKMLLCFSAVVLVSLLAFAFVIYSTVQIDKAVNETRQEALPRLLQTAAIARNTENMFASLRGFLLSADAVSLENYRRVTAENEKFSKELLEAARTDEGKKVVGELIAMQKRYADIAEKQVIVLKQAGKDQEAIVLMNGELTTLGRGLRQKAKEYMDLRENQINSAMLASTQACNVAKSVALGGGALSVLLGLSIGAYTARNIARKIRSMAEAAEQIAKGDLTVEIEAKSGDEIGLLAGSLGLMVHSLRTLAKEMRNNADHLAASSQELMSSAEQSADAANQVAQSVTDVAAGGAVQMTRSAEATETVRQMSGGIESIAVNTTNVAETADQTAGAAYEGKMAVEKAAAQMDNIEKVVNESAQMVGRLGERSKTIGKIVDTISGIASQTNLLALNAAIEAARAGEQGRGFAVVADEVRKLAEQSQEAAKQISDLINEIQGDTELAVSAMGSGTQEVKRGTEVVAAAGVSFEKIRQLVEKVSDEMRDVSAAIEELAGGSQAVVQAVSEIGEVTKDTALQTETISAASEEQSATMEEIAIASKTLAKMAESLQSAVGVFKT